MASSSGKGGKKDPKLESEKENNFRTFKPAHIKKIIKNITRMRVSKPALLACSAGLTYIILEILDGAKSCCHSEGKKKISPKHINAAITADAELSILLKNYVIQSGGSRQFSLPEITRKN